MRPDNVTDEAWHAAVMQARQDPHKARRLLDRGLLMKTGRDAMRLPPPPPRVNLAIRPKKKRRK